MSIDLLTQPKEVKEKFYALRSFNDLADLIEVKPAYLNYVLYRMPGDRYTTFEIPKKTPGEVRLIANPVPPFKIIQRKLKQVLEVIYTPRCSAYGFIEGRSIVDNARIHRKNGKLKYVLNIDLEDFFPSIHFGRVRGLFRSRPYSLPDKVAKWLAQICCYENGLPQGAPTSPIVSNMICNKMDSQLQRLAQARRCTYSRYADDITFSTTMPRFPASIAVKLDETIILGDELTTILNENNFQVNTSKVRLTEPTQRQEITGLTVNAFPNVRRKLIRQVRAMLHDWGQNGYESASERHKQFRTKHRYPEKSEISFRDVVRGKIEFIGMVRGKSDPIYRKYLAQLAELDPSVKIEEENMAESPAKIFISYARDDHETVREIYKRLEKSGYSPWMDTEDIFGGEDWQLAINRAIDDADLFIFVLSTNSAEKRGVLQSELKRALEQWQQKLVDDIYLIPLRIEECASPYNIKDLQWIDYFQPNGWNKLTKSIQEAIRRVSEVDAQES